MASDKPKIIVKKVRKKGHGGHHGGSWKVAYADFVTAMMAFFMVMWILGMDESTRKAVEGYFSNPVGMKKGYSAGASPVSSGNSPGQIRTSTIRLVTRTIEEQHFRQIAKDIQTRIASADGLRSVAANIRIVVTEQGLRIELVEGQDGETFFAFGSARLKPAAAAALLVIGDGLKAADAPIVVEGHTDSAPFGSDGYSNWELSADRANAARRQLKVAGVPDQRIREIRGYADHDLRDPDHPLDPGNRRISILLPFTATPPEIPGTEVVPGGTTGS
jgi:chemotaxis protein MotB